MSNKPKCFTIRTGKVVCNDSKGAKKNYNDNKVLFSNRKGTYKGKGRKRIEDAGRKMQKVVRGRAGRQVAKKRLGAVKKIQQVARAKAKPKPTEKKKSRAQKLKERLLAKKKPKKLKKLKKVKKIGGGASKPDKPKPKPAEKPKAPDSRIGRVVGGNAPRDANAPHVKYKAKLGKKLKEMTLEEQREYRKLQARHRRDKENKARLKNVVMSRAYLDDKGNKIPMIDTLTEEARRDLLRNPNPSTMFPGVKRVEEPSLVKGMFDMSSDDDDDESDEYPNFYI